MRYEDAVKLWGARMLEAPYVWHACKKTDVIVATVVVKFDFNAGYACCGGRDPDCYCSFAESPSADVVVEGTCQTCGRPVRCEIDVEDFDFVGVLSDIVDAGNGTLTSE